MADSSDEKSGMGSLFEKITDKITDKFHHDSPSSSEKTPKKIHHDSSSSSSDSESEDEKHKSVADGEGEKHKPLISDHGEEHHSPAVEEEKNKPSAAAAAVSKVKRIFGREKPVHKVLGGGKPADIFLWRDKKISGTVLGTATAIWVLFELLEYHLLTLVCHVLILSIAILFLWSNASTYINKSPPNIPQIGLPEHALQEFASALRVETNQALACLHNIASGKDLKKFLGVIFGLWILSIVGSWFNFVTLFYIVFVLMHTVPVLYEKYEDEVDSVADKAFAEIKKQYAVFDAKFLSKVPRGKKAA